MVKILLVFVIFIFGCNQPISNPESLDPGYADLKADLERSISVVKTIQSNIKEYEGQLTSATPQSPERPQFVQKIEEARGQLNLAVQKVRYYELALEARKKSAKTLYMKAFNEGKKWPSSEELEQYKFQRKLSTAPKSWDDHLPKSNLSQKQGAETKKEEKKEGEGGHKKESGH